MSEVLPQAGRHPRVPASSEPTRWHRFVAIGDSFTEGMSDLNPTMPDAYAGWADRLAAHLAADSRARGEEFGYANLAVRGRLLRDISGRQVDEALTVQPDLVSIVGGGNDILRPKADLDALAAELEGAVVKLREAGADVLLATPADPREAPVVRWVRGRAAVYTADVWSIAARHGCYVIDQWGMTALRDARLWAPDRIHLTTEGHRRVALNALATLGHTPVIDAAAPADLDWTSPLPRLARPSRRQTARADAQWAREYLGPWLQRRLRGQSSGDGRAAKRPVITPFDE